MNTSLRCAFVGAVIALVAPRPADASSCIPGFDYAAFGKESLQLGGGADTNSYDSSLGNYTTTNSATGGNVATNGACPPAAGAAAILNGASTTIGGNIQYG